MVTWRRRLNGPTVSWFFYGQHAEKDLDRKLETLPDTAVDVRAFERRDGAWEPT